MGFRVALLIRSSIKTTFIGLLMAVPHTSSSPWAAWVPPTLDSAGETATGRYSLVPAVRSRMSRLPPTRRGGTTE